MRLTILLGLIFSFSASAAEVCLFEKMVQHQGYLSFQCTDPKMKTQLKQFALDGTGKEWAVYTGWHHQLIKLMLEAGYEPSTNTYTFIKR